MRERFEAEEILRSATGGSQPGEGDSLLWGRNGWRFGTVFLGVLDSDPERPLEGVFWFNRKEKALKVFVDGEVLIGEEWKKI